MTFSYGLNLYFYADGKYSKMKYHLLLIPIILAFGCTNSECDDPVELPETIYQIQLKDDISIHENQITNEEIQKNLSSQPELLHFLEKRSQPVMLLQHAQKPFYDTISALIKKQYDEESIEKINYDLTQAYAHLNYYYPNAETPGVTLTYTGYGPVVLNKEENHVFIGAEFFLDFKPPLPDFPQYLFKYYKTDYIPLKIMKTEARQQEKYNAKDQTVLNEMIAWGKEYYFASQMVPCSPDTMVVEYTSNELKYANDYRELIWNHFVSNQIFYKTDRESSRKYLDPRPTCFEVSDKCPGMIGRWLGYEIVKAYMENNESTLQELMAIEDPKIILQQSAFKNTFE